ncbi:MAG: hypothetical protein Kow0088_05150 [Anaerolineales bacterium]
MSATDHLGFPEEDRVTKLRKQLEDLKRRLPAHSLPPSLMQQLDELEEALEEAIAQEKKEGREAQ